MGYFNFLPYWLASFAVPPLLILTLATGSFKTRVERCALSCFVSIAFLVGGLFLGFASAMGGFVPGIFFAVWGIPVLAIAWAMTAVVKASRVLEETQTSSWELPAERADLAKWQPLVKKLSALGFNRREIQANLTNRGLCEDDATLLVSRFPGHE